MNSVATRFIGKYEVLDIIGYGGMGVVYKAIDRGIGRLVAIKMVTRGIDQNSDLVRRFLREAQSAGMLQHPNIVLIYELGELDAMPFMVMEYLEGETLEDIIGSRDLDLSLVEKLSVLIQCCSALQYAHQRGVVHRDVKPANIMVLKDNCAKLVDFGIARVANDTFTRTGQVIGTVAYMSPEQLNGAVIDLRTDIFSISMVAFEFLTDVHPFGGKDTATTVHRIVNEPPPSLESLISVYPRELEEILLRGLCKDREERYASAGDMGFDLACLQERLKRELVTQNIERARELMAEASPSEAKELLKDVIRADSQNEAARNLMADVQQVLQKEHRSQQAQTLRVRGEGAVSRKDYDEAVDCLEQAVLLDKGNDSLRASLDNAREMREQAVRNRKEAIVKAVASARSMLDRGDLAAALAIIQNTREMHGDSTEIRRALRDWERQRQHFAKAGVERAVRNAEALLLGKQWDAAKAALENAGDLLTFVPAEVKAKYLSVRQQCAAALSGDKELPDDGTVIGLGEMSVIAGGKASRPKSVPSVGNLALQPELEAESAAVPVQDLLPQLLPANEPVLARPLRQRVLIVGSILFLLAASYVTCHRYGVSLHIHYKDAATHASSSH